MTKLEEVLLKRRIKACGAILSLQRQEPSPSRDEAIHVVREYMKLMEKPIDPNKTRGKIV